jgi:hypothetical protein
MGQNDWLLQSDWWLLQSAYLCFLLKFWTVTVVSCDVKVWRLRRYHRKTWVHPPSSGSTYQITRPLSRPLPFRWERKGEACDSPNEITRFLPPLKMPLTSSTPFHSSIFRNLFFSVSNHIVLAAKHPQMHDKILYAVCTEITSWWWKIVCSKHVEVILVIKANEMHYFSNLFW